MDTKIDYYGWSNIIINSTQGRLAFDPFFRPMYGANWAKLEDYRNVKVICVSHGHHEHYLDTPAVVKYTNAKVVSSSEVCQHLHLKYHVSKDNLISIKPFEEVLVEGFKITAFPWYHRKISYIKFLKGNFITGATFGLLNLLKSPYDAPYYGFNVITSDGLRLLNFTEGLNNLFPTEEMEELGRKFKPSILIGGMQLNYEHDVARGVQAIKPQTFIMYHPHEKLFGSMHIESSSPETFVNSIKRVAPQVDILIPKPMTSITVKENKLEQ